MKKKFVIFSFFLFFVSEVFSQKLDIGVFYGRFYATYRFIDDGTGFRNLPNSQYNGYPSITLNKKFSKKISVELKGSYLAYQQYTGTRLYSPGFYSVIYGGNISLTANYSVVKAQKIDCRIKAGFGIGIVPDKYQGKFTEIFLNPSVDSISRGSIKRDFTSIFPTFCTGFDFSYTISKRLTTSLAVTYQKSFTRITEYDIYYNDGSGKNDQHAKQWGNGSFYGFQLGLRYSLKDKSGGRNK